MDEKIQAAFAQMSEALAGIASSLTALTAKVDTITAANTEEMKAKQAAASEAAKAADAASLESFTAALSAATTAGTVTQGEGEELAELARTMPIDGRAKLAASFGKRTAPAAPPEKIVDKGAPVKLSAEEKADAAQKLIRAKLSADPGDYGKAVKAAKAEKPELFAVEEVK